jgi:hypothetical protein
MAHGRCGADAMPAHCCRWRCQQKSLVPTRLESIFSPFAAKKKSPLFVFKPAECRLSGLDYFFLCVKKS